jgi:beta-galactosidase
MGAIIAGGLMLNMSCQPGGGVKPAVGVQPSPAAIKQVINFNRDWKFAKGEQSGAEAADFNDSTWQAVRLPHDWAISGPFDPNQDGSSGKLPWWGVGWYRKTFALDKADTGRRVYFDFDGVMAFPKVYVNGQLAGGWDYGYMAFRVDATPFVKFGGENVIAVCADTRKHGTRWYPGAGIYRKVTETICEPVHIAHWGTYVTTPKVSDESATISVRSTIENHLKIKPEVTYIYTSSIGILAERHRDAKSNVIVEVVLLDPNGQSVATAKKSVAVPASGSREMNLSLEVKNPQRWDVTSPKLYTAQTTVRMGDKVVDTDTTALGIRTFEFTANDGFHLNGRRVQLHGVCLHHDQGALGAAFYTRAMERQLEIMRDMGVNAIRTSHNPPAPELLELCDKMGFVVWDECFDKWDGTADRFDPCAMPLEKYGEKQIRNFVMRDRNHPSVVVWSIGNEIDAQPGNKEGVSPERVKFMSDFVRKYDPTRPVGMACHIPSLARGSIFDSLDLTGWNYQRRYGQFRKQYPDKPIIYSESASALSTRGFYELPLKQSKAQFSRQIQIDSYDRSSVDWGDIADVEFNLMEKDKFVAGEFVWTGFDYLGEPTPYAKQARSSYFGIVDLAGIPKDRFYLYRSYWAPEKTTVHILPHWNWPDRIGQNVPVYVYTNGDSAELFLNGKSLGRKTKVKTISGPIYYGVLDKYRLCFNDVNYKPGELKAVAYKDGKEIGQAVMRTAGKPAAIRLTPDRKELSASGDDLCYILIEAIDANGVVCPLADNMIRFKVEGAAEIAGVDNGNPLSYESFQADYRKLFFGKAMLILRTKEGQTPSTGSPEYDIRGQAGQGGGNIRVTAEGDGLKQAEVAVQSRTR